MKTKSQWCRGSFIKILPGRLIGVASPILLLLLSGCIGNTMVNKACSAFKVKATLNKEVTDQKLAVQGQVPAWLHGTFVRNGPVSVKIDDHTLPHWFDGPAMLHAFSFQNGAVTYTNQFLKTDALTSIFTEGNFDYVGFATMPRYPLWERVKDFFSFSTCRPVQNANVNVASIAHRTVALTETPLPVQFDVKTLDTLGPLHFQDRLPKGNIFESAHPQCDRQSGEQFNYLVNYGIRSKYVVYRYNAECPTREVISEVCVEKPSYMHSFAITEHYIILVEFPFVVNPIDLLFMTKPFIKNFYWNPEQGTNFLVIDRNTGELVASIQDCNPFFAFHHVNAYEQNNNIILDIITYPTADIVSDISEHGYLSSSSGNKDENLHQTKLMRYTLSFNNASLNNSSQNNTSLHTQVLFDKPFELPRINELHSARPYRYIYGADLRPLKHMNDVRPIYKIDTHTRQSISWQEPGMLPGEPVFIPNPTSSGEEEGIIVNIVLDAVHQKAFLLMLDAKTFKELGRAYAPFAIPVGLHGQFFNAP